MADGETVDEPFEATVADRGGGGRLFVREHSPLYGLLSKIPARVHRGVMGYDLSLTAVAAHPRFIALGTNAGLVYWYDRKEDVLHRLWCADRKTGITKLALVESVELMLAAGNREGCLTIFQIQRPADPRLPPILRQASMSSEPSQSPSGGNGVSAEFFSVQVAHGRPVTALEWSMNGMRLFSGDEVGQVCVTEIDFASQTTLSRPVCREAGSIVQLSYSKPHLAVSSTERAVLVDSNEQNPDPQEIGKRPRKCPGLYGAVFQDRGNRSAGLFSVRPRNAVHVCGGGGPEVTATVLLSSLLARPHPDVPLVNPVIFSRSVGAEEGAEREESGGDIGLVKPTKFGGGEVVLAAYNTATLHLIRPKVPDVLASCSGLRGVVDLSTTSECGAAASSADFVEELFVLEGQRSLIRISTEPDKYNVMRVTDDNINPLGTEETEGVGIETVGSNLASVSNSVASRLQGLSSIGERLGIFAPELNAAEGESDVARDAIEATEAGNDALRLHGVTGGNFDDSCVVETRKSPKKKPAAVIPAAEDHHRLEDCDEVQGDEVCAGLRLELDLNSPQGEETEEEKEEKLMRQLRVGEYSDDAESRGQVTSSKTARSAFPLLAPGSEITTRPGQPLPEDENWTAYEIPKTEGDAGDEESHCIVDISPASENSGAQMLVIFRGEKVFSCSEKYEAVAAAATSELSLVKMPDLQAGQISVSANGLVHWKISARSASAANGRGGWSEVSTGARQVAVNDGTAFLLSMDGVLSAHRNLSASIRLATSPEVVACEAGMLSSMAATNGMLLALTAEGQELLGRVGMTASNSTGTSWAKIASLKHAVQSVDVCENHDGVRSAFKVLAVTSEQRLFFVRAAKDDLLFKPDLDWLEISVLGVTKSGLARQLRAKFGRDESVWLWHRESDASRRAVVYRNCASAVGVRWRRLSLEQSGRRVRDVIASGMCKLEGVLFATLFPPKPGRHEGSLAYSKLHDGRLRQVPLPARLFKSAIACVATAPEACWALTADGRAFMLAKDGLESGGWHQIDLSQLDGVRFAHLSLSADSAWAVDSGGRVWMRLGDISSPRDRETGGVPVWIPVESASASAVKFSRVSSAPAGHMVWAVGAEDGEVYARLGIYADFRLGVEWVPVSGVRNAVAVETSDEAAYALTAEGRLFRRCGVTREDYVGTCWREVPAGPDGPDGHGALTAVSATVCDALYGVDRAGRICELVREDVDMRRPPEEVRRILSYPRVRSDEDGGWALVE